MIKTMENVAKPNGKSHFTCRVCWIEFIEYMNNLLKRVDKIIVVSGTFCPFSLVVSFLMISEFRLATLEVLN